MGELPAGAREAEPLLRAVAQELGLELSAVTVDKFLRYLSELQKWNARINLTGLRTAGEIVHKHFVDSLALAPWVRDLTSLADIGTGAGFPGLPLKLVFPALALALIEATGKKVAFLQYLVGLLQLPAVEVRYCYLTPQLARDWGPGFQGVVSRATFSLSRFLALGTPLLWPGGRLIAMKGPRQAEAEWPEVEPQALSLGLSKPEQHLYTLPLSGERRQVILFTKLD